MQDLKNPLQEFQFSKLFQHCLKASNNLNKKELNENLFVSCVNNYLDNYQLILKEEDNYNWINNVRMPEAEREEE